ncbi:MAG: trypsin-like serine protease, partial [Alphaproteobacteria bacterium]|nr:trypsin-like serine protease [Alphaproteobacteria bacterium]
MSLTVTPTIAIPVSDPNDTRYVVQAGQGYDGVVDIRFDGQPTGTGALLSDGLHILTAAHLWDSNQSLAASSVTIRFSIMGDTTDYTVDSYTLHPSYVVNDTDLDNDVALIKLSAAAPANANRYELYTASDEVGKTFTVVGFGLRGTGTAGQDSSETEAVPRIGQNRVDALVEAVSSSAVPGSQLIFDFDNGTTANDAGTLIGVPDTGLGSQEVNTTQGDSGGPSFIDGKIAGITSYGGTPSTFGFTTNTDVDTTTNSTYGEFSSNVRVSYYADWITSTISGSSTGGDSGTPSDDYSGDTSTTGTVTVGGTATGSLESAGDRDWFAVGLTAGTGYTLEVKGSPSGSGTLSDPYLRLYDSTGTLRDFADDGGTGFDSLLSFTPTTTGTYYIGAGGLNDTLTGTYSVSVATAAAQPTLTVAAASVTEGDSGTTNLTFTATLSAAASSTVSFTYTTVESLGSSTEAATSLVGDGQDVEPTSNTATIAAGQTSTTFTVPVLGDTRDENNETFTVTLNSLENAQFQSGASSLDAVGTIIDDDGAPTLSISDASVTEADSFARTMTFTVSLSEAATSEVTVQYATSDGTATAGAGASGTAAGTSDYTATSGTLTFAAGETSKTVSVSVTGDIAIESDETFTVTLSNASGATLSDATATG